MIVLEIIFWLSVLAMFHSYVLYPAILKLFSTGKKENTVVFEPGAGNLPDVFVIFSAFNEEKVIGEKLESIYNTTYPANKLHVYIGSDNSTDKTNEIIEAFAARHTSVVFKSYRERNGKSNVLNKLVHQIKEAHKVTDNTVFIFTDANVMFSPATIYELAKHFKNETIGQVGANILNRGVSGEGISFQEAGYIQRENKVKYLEGLNWGTMMGAFGACHAIRATCWKEIPRNFLMEDFYLSMYVIEHKLKAIKELKAVCYEDVSSDVGEEYKRKTRIQAGNFQNLGVYWKLLFGFNAAAFCFLSHKVLRWFGPVFIAMAYISNAFLFPTGQSAPFYCQIYILSFVAQNLLLLTPFIDGLFKRFGINWRLLRFVSYFYSMNMALVKGFLMYLGGVKTNAWSPTRRNL